MLFKNPASPLNRTAFLGCVLAFAAMGQPAVADSIQIAPGKVLPQPQVIVPDADLLVKPMVCNNYAQKSVQQNAEASGLGCGFHPPVWSSNSQMHFSWCMQGNNVQTVNTHIQNRDAALATCKQNAATCKDYADKAVGFATIAASKSCPGASGPAWSTDYNAHYSWCMANPNPAGLQDQELARSMVLMGCGGP